MPFKNIYILTVILFLILGGVLGYFSSLGNIHMYYTSMGIEIPRTEKIKDETIEVQVCNTTEKDISEISIQSDTFFEKINSKTCSGFQTTKNLYKNLAMYVFIPSEKYSQELYQTTPLDLMGAEYLKSGKYTIHISAFESLKPPMIQRDSAIEYEIIANTK